MIKKVAVFSSFKDDITIQCLSRLLHRLEESGVDCSLVSTSGTRGLAGNLEGKKISRNLDNMPTPDFVFSVGGDGTFIETATKVLNLNLPIAGINTGRLGFLANVSLGEIDAAVEAVLNGKFTIIERYLLEVGNPDPLFGEGESIALNEITVQKADLNMITIKVRVNNNYLNTYWADGMIISTATGSTAYNISTGGPILTPGDNSIILSAICPHNLTIRPIVLPGSSVFEISIDGRGGEFLATCDFRFRKISIGTNITIRQSGKRVKTVMLDDRDFFSTLRSRLMWGADNRN